jgi:hypothetical protein
MTRAALCALLGFGCGSGLPAPIGGDAGDASTSESGAPICDRTRPFGAPQPIAELNTSGDDLFGSLSPDELTVYFDSGAVTANVHMFSATRPQRTAPFGPPVMIANLTSQFQDLYPSVTADGLTMYFTSNGFGAPSTTIFVSRRSTNKDPFAAPTQVATLYDSKTFPETLFVTADGAMLYFARGDMMTTNLFSSSCGPSGCTIAQPITELNTAQAQAGSVVSADQLTIYYGQKIGGNYDVMVARRPTPSGPFGSPSSVTELNSSSSEIPAWLSPDGCRMYINRTEGSAGTPYDLYVATRP